MLIAATSPEHTGVVVNELHVTQPGVYLVRAVVRVIGVPGASSSATCVLFGASPLEHDGVIIGVPAVVNDVAERVTAVLEIVMTASTASAASPAHIQVSCGVYIDVGSPYHDQVYTASISAIRVNTAP